MRFEEVGFTAGDRAVLDQQRIEIKGGTAAVIPGDTHRCPVGYRNDRLLAVLVQNLKRLKGVAIDAERNKEWKCDYNGVFFLGLGISELLDQALGRKVIRGAAGQKKTCCSEQKVTFSHDLEYNGVIKNYNTMFCKIELFSG